LTPEEMAFFSEFVAETLEGPPATPCLNAMKEIGIMGDDIPAFGEIWQKFAADVFPNRTKIVLVWPWNSRDEFLERLQQARRQLL